MKLSSNILQIVAGSLIATSILLFVALPSGDSDLDSLEAASEMEVDASTAELDGSALPQESQTVDQAAEQDSDQVQVTTADPSVPPLESPDKLAMKNGVKSEKGFTLPEQPTGNTGAYSFTIPIELPEGPFGLTPEISLSYSSAGSKRGELGIGWTLNAGSLIERKGGGIIDVSGNYIVGKLKSATVAGS